MARSRTIAVIAAVAAGSGALLVPATAQARAAASCTGHYGSGVYGGQQDLDGDRCADLVVGMPTLGSFVGAAGAGEIWLQRDAGISGGGGADEQYDEKSFGVPAEAGDRFGASVTYPKLDPDVEHSDLAVGAPGKDSGTGQVLVVHGSDSGLRADDVIVLHGKNAGEHFGASVVARGNDIWVGVPDRTVAGHARAGAVDHYLVNADGASMLVETIRQGAAGVGGSPEDGDHFGQDLSADRDGDLVVGVPYEDVGSVKDAGMVTRITMSPSTHLVTGSASVTQNTAGVYSTAETGDHFGAAVSVDGTRVGVGVPGEGIGSTRSAGLVHVIDFSPGHAPTEYGHADQGTPTVSGTPETGDRFGASVQLGAFTDYAKFDGDETEYELAVGAPGEDLGTATDAGTVTVLEVERGLPQRAPLIRRGGQGPANLHGVAASGDAVGTSLAAVATPGVNPDDPETGYSTSGGAQLAIDAPGWDLEPPNHATIRDAGVVALNSGAENSNSGGINGYPSAGERFGVVPNTASNGPFVSLGP